MFIFILFYFIFGHNINTDSALKCKSFQNNPLRIVHRDQRGSLVSSLSGTDRTNVCWVKEGCSSLKPKACSSLPLEVVDHLDKFDAANLNLHLNKGCYTGAGKLQAQLDNAPASCNPPCFRIKKPGEYCYMSTRNNNFSNRRHMGQITVTAGQTSEA